MGFARFYGFAVSGFNVVQCSKTECHPELVSGSDSVFFVS